MARRHQAGRWYLVGDGWEMVAPPTLVLSSVTCRGHKAIMSFFDST